MEDIAWPKNVNHWRKGRTCEPISVGQTVRLASDPEVVGRVIEDRPYKSEVVVQFFTDDQLEYLLYDEILVKDNTAFERY